jgi:hypothetical protein
MNALASRRARWLPPDRPASRRHPRASSARVSCRPICIQPGQPADTESAIYAARCAAYTNLQSPVWGISARVKPPHRRRPIASPQRTEIVRRGPRPCDGWGTRRFSRCERKATADPSLHHPQTERRLGPRALWMTVPLFFGWVVCGDLGWLGAFVRD